MPGLKGVAQVVQLSFMFRMGQIDNTRSNLPNHKRGTYAMSPRKIGKKKTIQRTRMRVKSKQSQGYRRRSLLNKHSKPLLCSQQTFQRRSCGACRRDLFLMPCNDRSSSQTLPVDHHRPELWSPAPTDHHPNAQTHDHCVPDINLTTYRLALQQPDVQLSALRQRAMATVPIAQTLLLL